MKYGVYVIPIFLTLPLIGSEARFNDVVIQSDGKIVAAGFIRVNKKRRFGINRYTSAGILDPTFGTDGSVTTEIGNFSTIKSIVIQSDSKFVAVGFSFSTATNATLARYNSNGTLDTTGFGTGGIVTTSSGDGVELDGVVLQTDGKIVAVGSVVVNGKPQVFVARYNTNGTLDSGFGTSGIIITELGNRASGNDIALQSDGKIVVAATVNNRDFAIIRYNTDGTLDNTFGTGGITQTNLGNPTFTFGVILQTDGKGIVVGNSLQRITLVRYTTTGALDTPFGTGGIVTTTVGEVASARDVQLQSDEKIVIVGHSNDRLTKARYNTTGPLDTTFGDQGIAIVSTSDEAIGNALAIQTNGLLVTSGTLGEGALVTRHETDGDLDPDFGIAGIVQFPVPPSNIGPTGPRGATGPTGPRGATGACCDNYLFVYDTTNQDLVTPNTFQNITFDNQGPIDGWTHATGAANLECQNDGTYFIHYDATLSKTTGTPIAMLRALLDGVEIEGSRAPVDLRINDEPHRIAHAFVTPVSSGERVRLQFTGQNTTVHLLPVNIVNGTAPSVSVQIVRTQ